MANKEPKDVVEKARALLKLAADDPDSEESRTAASKVVQLMKDNDLVLIPKSEVEKAMKSIGEATAIAKKAEAEKMQNMLLGGALGFMFGGGKLGKF